MSDIVEWLLQQGEWTGDKTWATEPHCAEAAEEITRLRAENENLQKTNQTLKSLIKKGIKRAAAAAIRDTE